MSHTAHGYWLEEAGAVEPRPPLAGDVDADVVVIGGGYTGLWTAWQLLRARRVGRRCSRPTCAGTGRAGATAASARRCGRTCRRWSSASARAGARVCRASAESVEAIGAWCEEQGVDAWFTRARLPDGLDGARPGRRRSTRSLAARRRAGRVRAARRPSSCAARCASPRFRRGVFAPDDATVQPARLALGPARPADRGGRDRLRALARHGRCACRRRTSCAETAAGACGPGAAVLALNAATRGFRPLRGRVSVTSSHIVLTEPVPDVLEALGWTGGESITDGRTFVHYFRTTPRRPDRVRLGRRPPRRRARGCDGRVEVDAGRRGRRPTSTSCEMFPALAGRAITHAWGGPIDVSPSHLPQIGTLDGAPVHYAFGFTGNGVGPSHLAGRILAGAGARASPRRSRSSTRRPRPCRPSRSPGRAGSLVRRAFLRKERLEEQSRAGRPAHPRGGRGAEGARDPRGALSSPRSHLRPTRTAVRALPPAHGAVPRPVQRRVPHARPRALRVALACESPTRPSSPP